MKCNFSLCDYLLTGEPKGVSDVRKDVIDTILKHEKLVKTEAAEIYSSIKRGSLKLEGHRRSLKKSKPANKKGLKTWIAPTSSIAIKQKHLQTSAKYGSPKVKLACKGSVCATDEPVAGQSQLYGSAQPTALEQKQLLKIQSSTEPPVQSSLSKQYKGQLATGLTSDVRKSTSGALFHTRGLSVTQSSSSSCSSPEMFFQKSPPSKSLPSKPLSSTSFSRNLPLNLPLLNEDIKPTTSDSEFPPQSLKTSVVSSAPPLRKSPDELVEKKEPKKLIKEFPQHKPKQAIQERTSISTSIANPVLSKESCLSSTVHAYLQEQSFKEDFTKKGECRIYCIFYCKFNKNSIVKQFDLETKPFFLLLFCFICHIYPPFTRKRIVSLYFGREVRTRLGVAFFEVYGPPVFHIKVGHPVKCLAQGHNKQTCRLVLHNLP